MFGTEGDGEENGNGLSALCSGVLCLFPLNWKSRYLYCFLGMWWTIPKKTNRKFLLIGHSLHRHYKPELNGVYQMDSPYFWVIRERNEPLLWLSICLRYLTILYDVKVSWSDTQLFRLLLPLFSMLNLHKISNRYINWLLFNAKCHLYSFTEMLFS